MTVRIDLLDIIFRAISNVFRQSSWVVMIIFGCIVLNRNILLSFVFIIFSGNKC